MGGGEGKFVTFAWSSSDNVPLRVLETLVSFKSPVGFFFFFCHSVTECCICLSPGVWEVSREGEGRHVRHPRLHKVLQSAEQELQAVLDLRGHGGGIPTGLSNLTGA